MCDIWVPQSRGEIKTEILLVVASEDRVQGAVEYGVTNLYLWL